MKRKAICSIVGVVLVALISSYAVPMSVQAQATAPACDVDLSQATAMMAQAQAKASSGDTDGAMALLDQVTQAISDIKEQCASSGAPVDLPQTYSDPSGIFTVNYPKDWTSKELPGSSDSKSDARPILLSSDSTVYTSLMNNKPMTTGQGIVVYAGSALQVAKQLGAFSSDANYDKMTALSLMQSITSRSESPNTTFGAAKKISAIGDFEAAECSAKFFAGSNRATAVADATLLIVRYSDTQFALLLGVTAPGKSDSIVPLTHSVAATIKIKAAQ